ncbi:MAG: beta-ketoacyl-[acyl-carrier-protein] synthase family protein [Gemmataceae bacterium]|nr:beta-ketoacyl-[acyl-carrier-protein] synthase family protein [Gemmataceae bacterium]
MSERRVVITGMGLVSPLGLCLEDFWAALRAGESGVRRLQAFDPAPMPAQIGGEVLGFDPMQYVEKKDRKRIKQMARGFQFVVAASQMALGDAQIDRAQLDPTRFGVFVGSSTLPGELSELGPAAQACTDIAAARVDLRKWGEIGLPLVPPMWLLNHIPNILACHVSILNDAQGPSNTITQTDAGGVMALGEGFRVIQRGHADVLLAGGVDNKSIPVNMVRHCKFASMSRHNEEPARACRPFDRARDGRVLGEGAGCFVLEELDHARRRGASIYAELAGFASTFDCGRTGKGISRAARLALQEARIGPEQLDHVNAHGYGTVADDRREAHGIRDALVGVPAPVVALKGYFGNMAAGGGPVELTASLLAFRHGETPATLNCDDPDPDCPIEVARTPRPVEKPYALKVAITELGQCAALVVRKWSE